MTLAVIGGGIVGMATAMACARHRCADAVVLLEGEDDLARHQTGHNSGVIHSGLYYKPGSLKASTCRAGLAALYEFCRAEGIPHQRCGKVVVAVRPEDLPGLDRLAERGRANGVSLRRLTGDEVREREPAVRALAGLWVEETGIVDYREVTRAMARRFAAAGGEIRTRHRVTGFRRDGDQTIVQTTGGDVRAGFVVNCAGLQSDRVARLAGSDPGVRIVPFRGEYYLLRPERASLVRGLIYPVPDPALPFLGVHFTRGIDGTVEAGPNAVLAWHREGYGWGDVSFADMADWALFPGFWRMALAHWRTGLAEMRRSWSRGRFVASLQQLIPEITAQDLAVGPTGVRAQAVDRSGRLLDDFVMAETPGMLHVLNAPSPAATASLAIGEVLAARVRHALRVTAATAGVV